MLTTVNFMRIIRIRRIKIESPTVRSFFFTDNVSAKARPGQFLMVWIPGVDEIPLGLSSMNSNGLVSVTVAEVGKATRALTQKKVGDLIGIRGPFGNCFRINRGKVLAVGGGIGMAPLMPLIEDLTRDHVKTKIILGARTRDELIFIDRLESLSSVANVDVAITTDDGSYGIRGVVTDVLERDLSSGRFDVIYACGPEGMLNKAYLLAEKYKTPIQVSLERIMRCAIGICGSCVIGKYRVCRDGPVFTSDQLREIQEEFGKFKHDFSGKKIPI